MKPQIIRARASHVDEIFTIRTTVTENRLDLAELAALGITFDTISAMLEEEACGWVALGEGQITGFSMIDTDAGELFAVFVRPGFEGRGIGAALATAAEAALFVRHPRISLTTAAGSRAEGFYRSRGWVAEAPAEAGDLRMTRERCAA